MHAVRRLVDLPGRRMWSPGLSGYGDGEERQTGGWLEADRTCRWSGWQQVHYLDNPESRR